MEKLATLQLRIEIVDLLATNVDDSSANGIFLADLSF